MSQPDQAQTDPTPDVPGIPRRQFYAPWMIGVLIVFAICEVLFFIWGGEAKDYAIGVLFLALFLAAWRYVRVSIGRASWVEIIAVIGIFLFFFAMLLPALRSPYVHYRHLDCASNLRQLGLAVRNYEFEYGRFPSVFVANEAGQPMHSWRTLLLPFFERGDLYDRYDFRQPWDAPENLMIFTEARIPIMQCPSVEDSGRAKHRTDYVAVTGDDTIWPTDGTARSLEDITIDPNNVAMLIEINNSDIAWYEPRDVTLEDLLSDKTSWSKIALHVKWSAFYYPVPYHYVVFADTSVRMIPAYLTPDQIRRMFSITEPIDVETEIVDLAERPIVYRHVIFYVWLATLLLQFVYIFFPTEKRR